MNQEHPLTDSAASAVIPTVPRASLWANASWTLGGNVIYAGCQFIWLILLAKLVTDDSLGDFILGLSIATPVFVFSGLSLRQVLATDVRGDFRFFEYVAVRLITTSVALAGIFLVSAVGTALGFFSLATVLVISAVGTAKAIENVSDIIFGEFQNQERLDLIGLSMTLKGALSLVGMAIGLLVTHTAFGAAIALSCVWLGVLFLFDLPQVFAMNGLAARPNLNGYVFTLQAKTASHGHLWSRMIQLCILSAPLAFAHGIYTLNPNIVQYFTRACIGKDLYGIFGTLQYGAVAGTMVMTAIGLAISPRLARFYAGGRYSQFRSLLARTILAAVAFGTASVIFTVIAGKPILAFLFKPEYAEYNYVLAWLLAAATLSYIAGLLGFAATATRTFHRFAIPYLAVSIAAIAASAIFVPAFGMLGAALAYVAIHMTAAVAFVWILILAGIGHADACVDAAAALELRTSTNVVGV